MKSSSHQFWEHFRKFHHEIESGVKDRAGSYQGLPKEALSTSLEDLSLIFKSNFVRGTFVDLGCGTGESVLHYALTFPERISIGIEFESARLRAARKFALKNSLFIDGDLGKDSIPEGDTYFLYFPTGPVLDRVLTELYSTQKEFTLIAVESHGDLIPRIKLENWLEVVEEVKLASSRHYPNAVIFKRNGEKRDEKLLPFTLSYQEKFILIEDWIGETNGMEWTEGDRLELLTPPRTIHWKDVKKLMMPSDISDELSKILAIRRQGELIIKLKDRTITGFIRKIIPGPTLCVEISNGEKVEWTKIKSIRKGSLVCYESSQQY
jgi:SAM-dependent methyltransferase